MTREELEILAKEKCDPALFYELLDNLEVTTNDELLEIINCTGRYRELLNEYYSDE